MVLTSPCRFDGLLNATTRRYAGCLTDMTRMNRAFAVVLCSGVLAASVTVYPTQLATPPMGQLVLPAGFRAEVFAENVENARSMALGSQGTVFVGSRTVGKVYAIVDRD